MQTAIGRCFSYPTPELSNEGNTMNGRRILTWWGIVLLAMISASVAAAQTRYQVGDIVEGFELIDRATGMPVKLSDLEGNVIFLEWFAWWCPFCRSAAAEIGPGIVDHYKNLGGNLNGVPVKHVGINLQSGQETDTQSFVEFYGLELVLNDFDRGLANRFQGGGQPIFAIINGVKDSPSHRQWELLYSHLGYGELDSPIATFRSEINAVMAGPDAGPEPEPEPEPMGPTVAPGIVHQPVDQTVQAGDRAEFIVAGSGEGLAYQWRKDGQNLNGQNRARLILTAASANDAGSYSAVVSNALGSITSEVATLTLSSQADGRLINLSSRSFSGAGLDQLVPSFVANGPMTLLVRAVGPTLEDFGVTGVLADPQFTLTGDGGAVVAMNDNWGDGATADVTEIREVAGTVGGFALREGGADAALLYRYDGGPRTAPVTGADGATGGTLVEVYAVPDETRSGRLANLAARGLVRSGESLVAGFVLGGDRARTLLIRGAGPALVEFIGSAALTDPQITIAQNGGEFVSNDDWSSDVAIGAQIATIATTAGAFAFGQGSADAALLITLSPGAYTVQVTGKAGASGIVLAEIYDVTGL